MRYVHKLYILYIIYGRISYEHIYIFFFLVRYVHKLYILYIIYGRISYEHIYIFFFLVRKTFFLPKLSQTCKESVVRGNLFEEQGFICYRPVNMMQQN